MWGRSPHRSLKPEIGIALLMVALIVLTAWSERSVGAYRLEVVLSGSMEPSLHTGSVILIRRLAPWEYRVGDIVSFRPAIADALLVTHRIASIYRNEQGVAVMHTKGDANSNGDPWVSGLGTIQGKELLSIPYLGFAVAWVKTRLGFLVFSLGFFLLCVVRELQWLIGQVGHLLKGRYPRMFLRKDGTG